MQQSVAKRILVILARGDNQELWTNLGLTQLFAGEQTCTMVLATSEKFAL